MKRITLLFIINLTFLIFNSHLRAQIVNIPDANFKAALVNDISINTNGDNEIQVSEASSYNYNLLLGFSNISDLTGIEAFTSLQLLDCTHNQLSNLNLSSNTSLVTLNCSNNQLTNLDVSANTNLGSLYCGLNQLSNINLSANLNLTDFSCYNNQLTALDLSHNTALTRLDCIGNQLSSLDLSANTLLTSLSCSSNQLTTLDLTPLTLLDELYCASNQLTYLSQVPSVMSVFWIPFNQIHCLTNLPQVSTVSQNIIFGNQLSCVPNQTNYSLNLPLCVANDTVHNPYHCGDNSCSALYTLLADSALQSVWYLANQCLGSDSLSADSLNYVWSWGDSLNSTSTGAYPSFTYSSPGNYVICVTITDPTNGCTSTYCDSSTYISKSTANQMIQVNVVPSDSPLLTGLPHHLQGREEIQLYPNPTHNAITISSTDVIEQVLLIDLLGNEVLKLNNTSHKSTLKADVEGLPAGIYICKVNGKLVGKVVKE